MTATAAVVAVILPLSGAAAAGPTATRSARPALPRALTLLHTFPLRSIRQSRGDSAVSVPFPLMIISDLLGRAYFCLLESQKHDQADTQFNFVLNQVE